MEKMVKGLWSKVDSLTEETDQLVNKQDKEEGRGRLMYNSLEI